MALNLFNRGVIAARVGLATHRLRNSDNDAERRKARRALAALFADARGVTMKFGQLMASGADDNTFKDLIGSIEPQPLSRMRRVIEQELGRRIEDVFVSLDESSAAASLGQVHRGVLKDGRVVAVKVQYPSIKDVVDSEMRLFGLMPGVGPVRKWGFDLEGYKSAIKTNMDRELDYCDEARRQEHFRKNLRVAGLVIPRVLTEFGGQRILVQDWQDGVTLDEAATWPIEDRQEIGRILLQTLFQSLFVLGEVHGDPHPGNFRFRRTPAGDIAVVLMDFGCSVPVGKKARLALLKMIVALREGAAISPLESFVAMGFDQEKLQSLGSALEALPSILLHPFLAPDGFKIGDWQLKRRFEKHLGENRWWFRAAGAPTLILLLRAFQGLIQQQEAIGCGLNWWEALNEALPRSLIDEARASSLPDLTPDVRAATYQSMPQLEPGQCKATSLRIRIMEGAKETVSLSMPADAALRLDELIPENVVEFLHNSPEWDIEGIIDGLRKRGIFAQEILNFTKETKTYHIWLE